VQAMEVSSFSVMKIKKRWLLFWISISS